MGKYILIEFDDDATADALCAQINTATAKGKKFRLAGIFAKPPKSRCTCGTFAGSQTRAPEKMRRRRHRKLGFWYCPNCKKVAPGPQSPKNQLDPRAPDRFAPSLNISDDGLPTPNYPMTEAH